MLANYFRLGRYLRASLLATNCEVDVFAHVGGVK